MMNILLTQTERKNIKEFISGLKVEKNKYRKCLEFIVVAKKEYVNCNYIVGTLFNTNEEVKGIARTKEGKRKEYKTIRGLINFLNKEYECSLDKEYIARSLNEVLEVEEVLVSEGIEEDYIIPGLEEEVPVPVAEGKEEVKEVVKVNNRIDFKKKIELLMGEKVELNVKIRRGQIEKLSIDEELKTEIYNHFMEVSDKKKEYIACSYFDREGEKVVCIELGKTHYEIVGKFNMLQVTEINKRGIKMTYYLSVKAKEVPVVPVIEKKEVAIPVPAVPGKGKEEVEPVPVVEGIEKKKIEVNNIVETTYEDNTYWIEYKINGRYGYDLTTEYTEGKEEEVEKIYNSDAEIYNKAIEKNSIDICSNYLREIIEECKQSDNEMWFVEFEDIREKLSACEDEVEQFINRIREEVYRLGINEYITFYEDDCAITVYGGIITQFLF